MRNLLVINLGLKSLRLIVFNENGDRIYSCACQVISRLRNGIVEQDACDWKRIITQLLKDLQKETGLLSTLSHLTSTTSSSCICGVDENGEPTTPVMMVSDKRAEQQAASIRKLPSFRAAAKKHRFQCSSSSTLPKILWVRDNDLPSYERTTTWVGAGEFLNHFLTGCYFTDPLNAAKAFYANDEYDADVYSEASADRTRMPQVFKIGSEFDLDHKVIREFGFNKSCKFVLTTYDAVCGAIGSFDGEKDTACDVSGTVTSVRTLASHPARSLPDSVLLSQNIDVDGLWLVGASNNLGGGIAEWCKQSFYDSEDKNVYYTMENEASQSPVCSRGIIFLPYLLGERAPFVSAFAKGVFFGIGRSATRRDFTRSCFEATAFVTRDLLSMSDEAGVNAGSLSVSGGLARFDLINQIKADVTNLDVKVVEDFESTSVGALALMNIATGRFSSLSEACVKYVRVRKVIKPITKNHEAYLHQFDLFRSLTKNLESSFAKHSRITSKDPELSADSLRNL